MPSLNDIALFFASLQTIEILGGLALTAAVLVVVSDWRISLFVLAVQYVFVASLLATLMPLQLALLRVISGFIAASMLYITARRTYASARTTTERAHSSAFLIGWHFRAVALVMVAVTVISFVNTTNLLNVPVLFWLVALWLMGTGLLIIALTRDVIKHGLGLLTFSAGFGALYVAFDAGFIIFGALNMLDLLLALGLSHLASLPRRHAWRIRRRHGES